MALTTSDLLHLADLRLREARLLQTNGLHDGAYYLGGYCVELGLKTVITSALVSRRLPNDTRWKFLRTHLLTELFEYACEFKHDLKVEFDKDSGIRQAWRAALNWSVEARYEVFGSPHNKDRSQELLDAIQSPSGAGLLPWLKTYS